MNLKNMGWLKDRALSDTDKLDKVKELHKLSQAIGISAREPGALLVPPQS